VVEDIGILNPAFHRVIGEEGTDFHGFIVIDEFVSGRGTGGIRFTDNLTLGEIASLAREMTLKFAFLRMSSGGAKAGLLIPATASSEQRKALSIRFGEAIGDLIRNGQYVAGLDLGTSLDDMAAIMAGAGIIDGTGTAETEIDSNFYTALTVLASVEGLLEARGKTLAGSSVLLEGLGKVGSSLLRLLDEAGARVVGVSTLRGGIYDSDGLDTGLLSELQRSQRDDCVLHYPGLTPFPPAELYLKEAELLIPGSGADTINSSNVDRILVDSIVPIANICATQDIEEILHDRGISFVPGFVSNSGGVFCWRLARLSADCRDRMIRHELKGKVANLVKRADATDRSIAATARQIALQNLAQMKQSEQGSYGQRLTSLVKKLSPRRLGYLVGTKIFNADWSRGYNMVTRSYFAARYFD
jgi:glutamate dehydrogenase/leucine dehydrogenase